MNVALAGYVQLISKDTVGQTKDWSDVCTSAAGTFDGDDMNIE